MHMPELVSLSAFFLIWQLAMCTLLCICVASDWKKLCLRVLQCRFELRLVEEESLAESLFSLLCFLWQLPCPFVVVILANMWDWALIATLPFFCSFRQFSWSSEVVKQVFFEFCFHNFTYDYFTTVLTTYSDTFLISPA